MTTYFGNFPAELPEGEEHLTMVFSSATTSLKERWKNSSLSADFLADYFANFFPGGEPSPTQTSTRAEIRSTISYIANELLENGLKFNYDNEHSISIRLQLQAERIVFTLTNSIDPAKIEAFQAYLAKIVEGDPMEIYLDTIEKNAVSEDGTASGLGFLTMLNDYGAQLGWRFETKEGNPPKVTLTTVVAVGV